MNRITLSYGGGGSLTHKLITELFAKAFKNEYLDELDDSAVFGLDRGKYAYTTDSYVVDPIFFPGGDIGKLAVCGTVNDLASCGAEPKFLTAGFILEEGLPFDTLEKIVASMGKEARAQNVKIVAGDTKVVPKGKADKVFINTSGLGVVKKRLKAESVRPGDKILINGPIAQHGLSILLSRESFGFGSSIKSDCNSLWPIVELLLSAGLDIRFMRDATRGGISAVANEVAQKSGYSLRLFEKSIPIEPQVRHLCEILGLEPLDIANEGKMLFFVSGRDTDRALEVLKKHPLGKKASVIGVVAEDKKARVLLKTGVGGEKVLGFPVQEPIPRIC
ncbi:MAG TPA: hydrogenase expression/formation protein HypE [Candidatus Omnitrophica bacterium]|nr:hydrogenase expression/formation protein HypE [Candidatus Omnitrophota bacterium]